ncbi:MAG: hypothetical protein BGO38_10135 [Cellulomonas sp. 73-145]|nr:MAG: hypothetical protein BGO38_10135 [Cellulomonas sp. 73-145]
MAMAAPVSATDLVRSPAHRHRGIPVRCRCTAPPPGARARPTSLLRAMITTPAGNGQRSATRKFRGSPGSGEAGGAPARQRCAPDVREADVVRLMIRVDSELPEGALAGFPGLSPVQHPAQTSLVGPVQDPEELQGILNRLAELGVAIVEVVTIPD